MAERLPHRQSSTNSQHSSTRYSNPDVFSDEYSLEAIPVSDGFRPNAPSHNAALPTRTTSRTAIPRRPVAYSSQHSPPADSQRKKSWPAHGLVKPSSHRLTSDGPPQTPVPAPASAMSDATSHPRRHPSTTTVSSFSMPPMQTPYEGATGPSHPYAMYPQNTLHRTSTISSMRAPERSYGGPSGPTHPYGMYPQDVVPEGEVDPPSAATPTAPVGFPGRGQHYTRRLGPDGEEADDIIGPDGHTEQLPPYTRYPDAAVTKERYAPGAADSQDSPSTPLQMVQTFRGADDGHVSEDENAQINVAAAEAAGFTTGRRQNARQRWATRSKKRTCCGAVPRWAVVLIIVLAVSLATVLGGVIGRWVSSSRGHGAHDDDGTPQPSLESAGAATITVVTTAIPDATPIASPPPNLPTLPKGDYGVPLGQPTESLSSCLQVPAQVQAWGCVSGAYMGLNVTPSDYGSTQVSVYSSIPATSPYSYGPQVPMLNSQTTLSLVTDNNDPTRGPAYFFQQTFDKVVILPPNTFSTGSSKRAFSDPISKKERRDLDLDKYANREAEAGPGAQPWFCYWNNTILEGFIYVTLNISSDSQNTTEMVNSLLASVASVTALPTATSSLTSTPAPPASATSSTPNYKGKHWVRDPAWPSAMPTIYPKVVKIEERRNSQNSVQPYCQQMQILDDLTFGPLPNSTGRPTIFQLNEVESTLQSRTSLNSFWRTSRRDSVSACSCEWLSS